MGKGSELAKPQTATPSFRLNKGTWDAFEEVADGLGESRAELLRQYVNRRVDAANAEETDERQPPEDDPLRSAWLVLSRYSGEWVRWRHVESEIAQATARPKDILWGTVVKPLAERGYVRPHAGVYEHERRVKVHD